MVAEHNKSVLLIKLTSITGGSVIVKLFFLGPQFLASETETIYVQELNLIGPLRLNKGFRFSSKHK
jgi:hypothetical protein